VWIREKRAESCVALPLLSIPIVVTDVSVIVADVNRLASIREGVRLPGRMMHFTSGSLAAAMESIRSCRPRIIAIDALFAQTSPGAAFLERVEALAAPGSRIKLIVQHDGKWFAAPPSGAVIPPPLPRRIVEPDNPVVAPPADAVIAVSSAPAVVAAQIAAPSTRRAPRFAVQAPISAAVESGRASVIDISVLGAQVVSLPTLRPNQRITLSLPDSRDMLNLVAQVAWSMYEKPNAATEPYYRAGIEFTRPAQEALEDYRQRRCASQPIPYRGR
jgi:hypothetical protein